MRTLRAVWALILALSLSAPGRAADRPPADRPIPAVIDHFVDDLLKADEITPASQADDATLVRRLTLDLAGRIPTLAEAEEYVNSSDPGKRSKLVERLLASPAFVRFQAAQFDVMLNSTVAGGDRRRGGVGEYLLAALQDGKSWDRIFRELMLPDESDPRQKGAVEYLRARVKDHDQLTNDVSVAFFGVNVSCAQCHDHPHVTDWKQDHFYGMKSFFARSFEAGGQVGERGVGLIKFKPTRGPERTAKLLFLTGSEVQTDTLREPTREEQKKEKEFTDKAKAKKGPPPAPAFSARKKLVELALSDGQNEFFARAFVNRIWHRLLGRGLVEPLDQMHAANEPSHPELLAWLARDTARHGYDLKRLVRGIVLSRTYSRSSRYDSESHPPSKYFAVARLKALTPGQLATSLKLTGTDPATFEKLKGDELEKRLEGIESSARGFASAIAQPTDDFQIGVGEALLFSNSDRAAKEFLTDGSGTLLGRVKAMTDPREAIGLMVKTAYGRPPTPEELSALVDYVTRRNDRPAEAYRQVLWALMTASEFRFCY